MVPKRLRAQYPQEMTIVLQHQFWDLKVDEAAGEFSVGLSFGGVPTVLHVPFAAVSALRRPGGALRPAIHRRGAGRARARAARAESEEPEAAPPADEQKPRPRRW